MSSSSDTPFFPDEYIWEPSAKMVEQANVTRFMVKHGIADVDELIRRSAVKPDWFWPAAMEDLGVVWFQPFLKVLDTRKGVEWTRWFVEGQINMAYNCLDKHLRGCPTSPAASANACCCGGKGQAEAGEAAGREEAKVEAWERAAPWEREALVWEGELGAIRRFTYLELAEGTNRLANGLRSLGVKVGDTVGLYLPLVPETVMALLACFKVGAIAIPIFSGYAPASVSQRLVNAEARVLLTADRSTRRGKLIAILPQARQAAAMVPSLEHLVVLRRDDLEEEEAYVDIKGEATREAMGEAGAGRIDRSPADDVDLKEWDWRELVEDRSAECESEWLDSEAVAMILYTSGTTGLPKGTVHTHGGTLAQVAKELGYHFDLKPSDRFFWLTDIGWMMGPWAIIGVLHHSATLFIFEGAPDYPDPGRLWDMASRHRLTHLSLSPTAIRLLKRSGKEWPAGHDLSSLRILGSTGEPWDPESYGWFFHHVGGGRCPIINISGGTDIMGCFLAPLPVQPLKSCSLGGPGLGMATEVYDEGGWPVREQVGYLVCSAPGPSMTRGLWKAPEKYLSAYWSRWPGIWDHGDWAYVDGDGQWFLLGRADDTLKVAGRRIGPSEIEGALMDHPAVAEAAAVGIPHDIKGTGIATFVVLAPGHEPSEELRTDLGGHVAALLGKVDRPDRVLFVTELPKTRSAKILRRMVREVHLGKTDGELGDISSLERPQALEAIRAAI